MYEVAVRLEHMATRVWPCVACACARVVLMAEMMEGARVGVGELLQMCGKNVMIIIRARMV